MAGNKTVDVVVVGGGVIGSSIAYELSLRGISTLVLEQNSIASEASSAAAGMLAAQGEFIEDSNLFQLALRSRSMFPQLVQRLKEASGMDVGFVDRGLLRMALKQQDVQRYKEQAQFQQGLGLDSKWLTKEETLLLEPSLAVSIEGALLLKDDHQVIASQLTRAYAMAAAAQGAQIREYAEVHGLFLEHGEVKGVRLRDEVIHCNKVVIASSIWATGLLRSIDYDLPITPVKGDCIAVRLKNSRIQRTIYSDIGYLVPKANGELIIGATAKHGIVDRSVSLAGISSLIRAAEQLVPSIRESEWIRAWSGLRPNTPTGLPYMGEHPELQGLFLAAGHYRNGILLSPVTGRIIADLIEGNDIETDLSPYSIPVLHCDPNKKMAGVNTA
ncbi:Glycine oxidase [compost metagenome]